ncbi:MULTISPECIES: hypothetical protein [unclassified Nocardiopsis]|uniref:hypothetical protein n=1 Tax=Nocardiopsis TaxID=2013 RepID=UPI00387B85D6
MAATVVRGRRWKPVAAVGAAAAVIAATAVFVLADRAVSCGCANPDAGLDVEYGTLGPGADAVQARLEVVEVAAVPGYTRTVLEFTNQADAPTAFDPAYFTGGAGPGDGFRIWDPGTGRLYENRAGLGTVTGDEVRWEPRTPYEIVLYSAPLEPGTETVEVRGPQGAFRVENVGVREGGALWEPGADEGGGGGAPDGVVPVIPDFRTPAPGTDVPGYTEAFSPPAPEPVGLPVAAAETDDEGWVRFEEGGRTWRMFVGGYRVEDGVLTLGYRLDVEYGDAPAPGERPDLFPEGLTLIDPATGAVVPELRVGDPEGESEPLWSIAWPRLWGSTPRILADLSFADPGEGAGDLLLDAGVFGALPVEHLD